MILYLILLILVVICQWVCKTVVLIRVSYFRVLIFFLWIPNRGNLEFPKTSLYWFSFSLFSNKMAFFIPRQAADEARHLIRRHQSFCRACVRPRLRVISGLPVPGARAPPPPFLHLSSSCCVSRTLQVTSASLPPIFRLPADSFLLARFR